MSLNPVFESQVREGFQNQWCPSGILNNELQLAADKNNMHKGTEASEQNTQSVQGPTTIKVVRGHKVLKCIAGVLVMEMESGAHARLWRVWWYIRELRVILKAKKVIFLLKCIPLVQCGRCIFQTAYRQTNQNKYNNR